MNSIPTTIYIENRSNYANSRLHVRIVCHWKTIHLAPWNVFV